MFPLPPVDLGHKLVDAYFSNYDRTWCMLHRAHFERQLASGKLETDLSFRSLCEPGILALMSCAC